MTPYRPHLICTYLPLYAPGYHKVINIFSFATVRSLAINIISMMPDYKTLSAVLVSSQSHQIASCSPYALLLLKIIILSIKMNK